MSAAGIAIWLTLESGFPENGLFSLTCRLPCNPADNGVRGSPIDDAFVVGATGDIPVNVFVGPSFGGTDGFPIGDGAALARAPTVGKDDERIFEPGLGGAATVRETLLLGTGICTDGVAGAAGTKKLTVIGCRRRRLGRIEQIFIDRPHQVLRIDLAKQAHIFVR